MTLPKLNNDITLVISKFLIKPDYKLLDWIKIGENDYKYLSSNPNSNAIEILMKNPDKIDWEFISLNPSAIKIIKENLDKIDWNLLSSNRNAIELLKENPDKINWSYFSRNQNPNAIELLRENRDNINWTSISKNESIFRLYDNSKIVENKTKLLFS